MKGKAKKVRRTKKDLTRLEWLGKQLTRLSNQVKGIDGDLCKLGEQIAALGRRKTAAAIQQGKYLVEARSLLPHKQWMEWHQKHGVSSTDWRRCRDLAAFATTSAKFAKLAKMGIAEAHDFVRMVLGAKPPEKDEAFQKIVAKAKGKAAPASRTWELDAGTLIYSTVAEPVDPITIIRNALLEIPSQTKAGFVAAAMQDGEVCIRIKFNQKNQKGA